MTKPSPSTLPLAPPDRGLFDARFLAFLETLPQLRPTLHRYCSRMTGSALEGEDVVQEALFRAFLERESLDEARPLTPWLLRIAHPLCLDPSRRPETRQETERPEAALPEAADPGERAAPALEAIEHLGLHLPPEERACVLLKDVFDYSLEEIAELVDSSLDGVEAALQRGRARLAEAEKAGHVSKRVPADPELARLVHLYVERFNRRDWDGLRELVASDARLLVADRYAGSLADSPYFGRWEDWQIEWRFQMGEMDGRPVAVILLRGEDGHWAPRSFVHVEVEEGRIRRIADYLHTPWVSELEGIVLLPESS